MLITVIITNSVIYYPDKHYPQLLLVALLTCFPCTTTTSNITHIDIKTLIQLNNINIFVIQTQMVMYTNITQAIYTKKQTYRE